MQNIIQLVSNSRTFKDFSISTIGAGLIATLVGYTSSAALVFQAARSLGLGPLQASSWLGVLCLTMGLLTIVLSYRHRIPLMFAWSTPGAALLLTTLHDQSLSEATGAFVVSAALIAITGLLGKFDDVMKSVPSSIASAMLAGVLLRFSLESFAAIGPQPALSIAMLSAYILGRKFFPRYAILSSLFAGVIAASFLHLFSFEDITTQIAVPVFTVPHFTWISIVSVAIPLYIVTMTSQNMTGFTVLRSFGYDVSGSRLMTVSGVANLIIAPFGGFAINLAAITAAICMSPESHPDKHRRYTGAMACGFLYILMGVFSGFVGTAFAALPKELIFGVAGIALFATVTQGLVHATEKASEREAAMMTFFMTASGVTIFEIGSAFWGLVVGFIVYKLLNWKNS